MSLRFGGDPAAAAWLAAGGLGSDVSATLMLGPSGFEAYARILALPDPSFPGQAEADIDEAVIDAAPTDMALVDRTVATLTETTHDEELFFLLWDGWPYRPPLPVAPTVEIGGIRRYVLASGTRKEWLAWTAGLAEGAYAPGFVWPTDHRWCVAMTPTRTLPASGARARSSTIC